MRGRPSFKTLLRSSLSLITALALTGSLAACGREASSDQSGDMAGNEENGQTQKQVQTLTIPENTALVVAIEKPLSTESNHAGDTFKATTVDPVSVDGRTVIPAGAEVTGRLTEVVSSKEDGPAKMTLELTSVNLADGSAKNVTTGPLTLVEQHSTEKDVEKVAAGGVAGGVIGGILGGKKGAAIGAAVGAGAGTIVAIATKGESIDLPQGQKLQFATERPAQVPVTAAR